ncbi:MAG TPA: sensor histidine kinase KdpD, partial [Polyangiaceae bacterium]|nr:sensor histidine kinase KdpD [Polyangiaceae bacterium]
MSDGRPDPDLLLQRVREEDVRAKSGKLTIFFGAAPGVGKTYSMLEAARAEHANGRDMVVGIVETHGRYDTAALLLGLEILPRQKLVHRTLEIEEFDLDRAIERRPGLLLVDELAHTNVEGSRHPKRWQDVVEILDAGIDVFTTLNVQHVESLKDVVAQITHVIVHETVPDSVLDRAHDIRVIDLPPDELLERMREGKIYVPEQARRAVGNFFRKGNLIALRELALRRTAERVDAQMQHWKREHGIVRVWPAGERVLVCVSPSPASARLVRGARRLASSLHADWIAVYVETPASLRQSREDNRRVAANLQLAQQLGAEAVTISGTNAAEEAMRYAHQRNVTRVVVGKPTHSRWRDRLNASFLDDIVRHSGDVDVYVLSGEQGAARISRGGRAPQQPTDRSGYLAGVAAAFVATVLSFVLFKRSLLPDTVMVYLLGIVLVSMRFGYGPSLVTAVVSVLCYDFFFIPPYMRFSVTDLRHLVTFAVMLLVAGIISRLTTRVREQAEATGERERRTASLYAMSRELATAKTLEHVVSTGARHVADVFQVKVSILRPVPGTRPILLAALQFTESFTLDDKEQGVANWVWQNAQVAGAGTDTLPSARGLYLPMRASRGVVGVLGVLAAPDAADAEDRSDPLTDPQRREHLEAFASQIAAAMERAGLAEEAQSARLQIESEQLRNSLLSSVSHDLRTPLAVVTGAASTLLEGHVTGDTRRELTETILHETDRLNRLVRNLLDVTRVEGGALQVHKEWQPLEEVVGSALHRLDAALGQRPIATALAADLPLVPLDSVLIEQVLVNLLENAAKYTPSDAPIDIEARAYPGERQVQVTVADRGAGIPAGEEERIFDKFFRTQKVLVEDRTGAPARGQAGEGRGGAGLGLTICRGIVSAHGGRIWADNREGGGAAFHFTLPIEGEPPTLEPPNEA